MTWQLGLAMVSILIGVPLLAVYATQASFWSERAKFAASGDCRNGWP